MRARQAFLVLPLAVVLACGGEKPKPRTAADEPHAPPPPTDREIKQAQTQQKETDLTEAQRADFDATVAKWEEAKKAGPVPQKTARDLASKFSSIARQRPELAAQAYFNAGTLYETAGDAKDAENAYNAALQANPAFGPALNNLGEIYYKQGSKSRAKEWFEKAVASDPTQNAPAYNNLAVLAFEEARQTGNKALYKEAVSKLRRALAIDNDSMAAYELLALIYYVTAESDKSKLQLAELVCKQAKERNDKYAPIYNTLGLIQLRKKNLTGALKEFEKAVELDNAFVEAHLNIGAIGLSSRQYEKAQKSFDAVLKLQPENFDATVGLGVALRGQKKFDEAEQMYKKAQQLDPKSCAVAYNLGLLYQDYKTPDAENNQLRTAQEFYRKYVSCGNTVPGKVEDANRRIKDIDDLFAAIEQQKKLEAELKAQQAEMERQQKEMEEKAKQQQPPPADGAK